MTSKVVTAAPSYNLTTLAALKLEFDIQDTSLDVYLSSQIPRVSRSIASHCRRQFALQRYRDGWSSDNMGWNNWRTRRLFMANRPIIANTMTTTIDSAVLLVEGIDFKVDYDAGIIFDIAGFGSDIEIEYDAGWVLPSFPETSGPISGPLLPEDIEQAAIAQVLTNRQIGRLAYTDRDPFLRGETVEGIGSQQYSQTAIGSGSTGSIGGLSQAVKDLLAPYVEPALV